MSQENSSRLLRNRPKILLIIFFSALSVKLLIFFLATDPIVFFKYPYFAQRISEGSDIGERVLDISPLYLYVNLFIYKIYGKNWEVLAFLQIFLGSLNCLLIYFIGEKVFGRPVGLVAAFILLLYGNLTLIELTLEPESFLLLFNSLFVLILIQDHAETNSGKNSWKWLLAGAVIGLAAITKPNALLLLPVAIVWVWQRHLSPTQSIKAMLLLTVGTALLVSPITIRNYVKFQDFVLLTADGGKVFFHGNGPGSTGMERADLRDQGFAEERQPEPDYAHSLFRKTARVLTGRSLKPSECARFWFGYTLDYIRAHPLSAFILEVKKFFYFWGNYEVHDIDSAYKNYRTLQTWPLLPFGIISALGIVGLGLALKKFRQAFLLYAMILVYLFSALVFFVASRYRLPAAPFLAIFAAYTVISLYTRLRERHLRKFLVCVGLVAALFAGTHLFFRSEIETIDRWQRATRIHYSLGGNLLFKKGLYREAIPEFAKAIELEPDFAPAYNGLGMSYAVLNDFERAEKNFRRVIELSPGIDQGYLNLGLLYQLKGEPSKALPLLEKAFLLNPENPKTKEHLQTLRAGKQKG
jgi:4-amino-4-deoxy-L-arabinose transferase-like glycosyltransferase